MRSQEPLILQEWDPILAQALLSRSHDDDLTELKVKILDASSRGASGNMFTSRKFRIRSVTHLLSYILHFDKY